MIQIGWQYPWKWPAIGRSQGTLSFTLMTRIFFYVVDGTATFVVGGKGIGMKQIAPGEFRGTSIEGGEAFHLKKGDVSIVPKGTPHQYTEVNGSIDYFVVKATSSQGG
jgi:mannose-6-phosphate isomerase-like protein (cupin superfamily)